MRLALPFLFLTTPAAVWEFTPSPICTLTETTADGTLTVTYDASLPEYAIAITLAEGTWPRSLDFGMAFAGGNPVSIGTNRHQISSDGRTLTVTDRGFGNVLNGLEFNTRAYAMADEFTVGFPLEGIKPAITAFRDCPALNLT
ncbi:MAG: excinuclease ABC subunit B [Pseudomonadota bacterium]